MAKILINDDDLKGLEEKVVVITGGSAGIGRATAQLCLDLGAKVMIGDVNPPTPAFEDTDRVKFMNVNATSFESLRDMFDQTIATFGRVDHVFANAGISATRGFLDVKIGEDGKILPPPTRVLDLNFTGALWTIHLGAAYMTDLAPEQHAGTSIVVAGSASSFLQFRGVDYTIAKHGVLGMVRGLDASLQERGVRINAIAPSWTNTAIVDPQVQAQLNMTFQTPEDVARSVALLFVDQERKGQVLYSWQGNYREINRAEGGLLTKGMEMAREED